MFPFIDSLVLTPPPHSSSHAQSPPHTAGPAPDLQSQLRPFQGLDLQHQLQQLNISQCSGGDTSPAVVVPPLQTQLHHGCSVVMSNAVTNGNPVHGQSNMEAPGGCVRGRVCSMCMGVSLGCVRGVSRVWVCEDISGVCPA